MAQTEFAKLDKEGGLCKNNMSHVQQYYDWSSYFYFCYIAIWQTDSFQFFSVSHKWLSLKYLLLCQFHRPIPIMWGTKLASSKLDLKLVDELYPNQRKRERESGWTRDHNFVLLVAWRKNLLPFLCSVNCNIMFRD